MKKIILLFFVVFASITLFGCEKSEYQVDGEFLAYAVSIHSNSPMVTSVTVTIEDGKIAGYYIDARQGVDTKLAGADGILDTADDTWTYVWNTMTKKELGDDYNMVENGGAISEWYVQAALIEDYLLANGFDSVTVDAELLITNVAGVTIKDGGYLALAAEALELAKEGKFQAIYCTADDLVTASMIVSSKGVVSELVLDTLQGKPVAGTFAWATQSKQQLGDAYGMATVEGQLEWYEQANAITAYVLENGWSSEIKPVSDRGISLNGTTNLITGVTIKTSGYISVLSSLFGYAGDSVK